MEENFKERDNKERERLSELAGVSIAEFLNQDARPTFLVDLDPDTNENAQKLTPVFCNSSLHSHSGLLDVLAGEADIHTLEGDHDVSYAEFKAWVTSVSKYDESADIYPQFFLFCGMLWTGSTIRKRWRVISGNQCYRASDVSSGNLSSGPPSEIATARSGRTSRSRRVPSKPATESTASITDRLQELMSFSATPTASDASGSKEFSLSTARESSSASNKSEIINMEYLDNSMNSPVTHLVASDWTADMLDGEVSDHMAFVRQVNWSSTASGSMSTWTAEMRQMVNFLMASPHPGALYWGDDLTIIYNEAYKDVIAGSKHPYLMGASFREGFSEISHLMCPIFAECRRTGRPVSMVNQMVPIESQGILTERYFSWSFVPIYGGGTEMVGFYSALFETTKDNINERRTRTLLYLGNKLGEARTVKSYWENLLQGIEPNTLDFTFALLYSVADDNSTDDASEFSISNTSDSSLALKSCFLEGTLGVPTDHISAPRKLDLKRSREGFIPSFREATRTRLPTVLRIEDGTLPEELIEDIKWRGFGEVSRRAIILPIRPTTGENVMGFLIFGLNPRRPWDEDYQSFVHLLNGQLSSSLASVVLYEEEIRRGELSALEQAKLLSQLDEQQKRVRTMAEVSPVGMFYIDSTGLMLEANDKWYEITGHSLNYQHATFSWLDDIHDDSRLVIEEGWTSLTVNHTVFSAELRFKTNTLDPVSGREAEKWMLTSCRPDLAPDGSLRSVLGSIIDITEQKASARHTELRAQLSEKLLSALQEHKESELRFHSFATLIPIGVSIFKPSGEIIYCNPAWWKLTGFGPESTDSVAWVQSFHTDDIAWNSDRFEALTKSTSPTTFECRMDKSWTSRDGTVSLPHSWFLCSTTTQFADDGTPKAVLSCLTDISNRKYMEEQTRLRKEEALERAELSERLARRTQEAAESQMIFRRFSDLSPCGLVIHDRDGKITYANDQWFKIGGHPRDESAFESPISWQRIVHESCIFEFQREWDALIGPEHRPINMEMKSSKPWERYIDGQLVLEERWILAQAVADVGESGSIVRIMGCVTDISRIKWAETLQNRRLEEAEETRRQQNNFIDITSHEMRNPLSAMIQCADGISSSLHEYRTSPEMTSNSKDELIESCIEAAETVMLCAQHQKSIIDDILTLSKLDSNLLMIVPDVVRPVEVVRRALRMVDSELKKYDMTMTFNQEVSLAALQVEWVIMDAARVLQILINLLTNAIKFTQAEPERSIAVSVSAFSTPPSSETDIEYFPAKLPKTDATFGEAWGSGEIMYLRIKVKDTGVGLSPDEKKLLFLRFSQASPKTHTQYGGSGLGLFISRQLTELQGGQIGFASESGRGSTFAFFVKVRRTNANGASMSQPGVVMDNPISPLIKNKRISADGGLRLAVPEVVVMPANAKKDTPVTSLAPTSKTSLQPTAKNPRIFHILVVEDNLVNQRVLTKQLRKAGCVVTVANNGMECLDFLRKTKFYKGMEADGKDLHVVLLDLEMPILDGLTCIRTIRKWEKAESLASYEADEAGVGLVGNLVKHVPVIAITANARHEQVENALHAGMDDVLPKPFRITQLMPKIEALLGAYET